MQINQTILSTVGVSKYFGGLHAIENLDVTVKTGQIYGVIGPNGAGKTTFINVITGLVSATEGKLYFEGNEITDTEPHIIARMGISRTFQVAQIFPMLTCLDNVMIGQHYHIRRGIRETFFRPPFARSTEEAKFKRRALEILEFVGLPDSAERWGSDLSWAECELLQIARALASEPKLVLLDEPTVGMGIEETEAVARIIKKIRESGVTVMMISHDMKLVMRLVDWITVLSFGKKICEGTPEQVQKDPQVLEAYLGTEG